MTNEDSDLPEDNSLDGSGKHVPGNDSDGTVKADGLGSDGTIPSHAEGVAAGYTGTSSNFEPEEDEQAE